MVINNHPAAYYTWIPYQPRECSQVRTIRKLAPNELFSWRIPDRLHRCPLLAVTSLITPLVINETEGVESRIFVDLTEKLDMQFGYVDLPAGTFVWTPLLNGSPANGFKLLYDNQVDILFSDMSRPFSLIPFADFLPFHTVDALVWFVPSPAEAPIASAIFSQYPHTYWTCILLTGLFITITTSIIIYVETHQLRFDLLSAVALSLNLPYAICKSQKYPKFAGFMYLLTLHLTTAYQSYLIIFLSDAPREKPLRTLRDLARSDLKIQILESHDQMIARMAQRDATVAQLAQPGRLAATPWLRMEVVAARDFALFGPKLHLSVFLSQPENFDQFGYTRAEILRETPTIPLNINLYVSKGHPLFGKLELYQNYLIEGGFPQFYLRKWTSDPYRHLSRHARALSLRNFEGLLMILASGWAICVVVWLGELILWKYL